MKEKPLEGVRVCVDPGHPSENGIGTRGRHATEVGVAWRIALLVQKQLAARGATVLLTKARERQSVTNRRRAEIANKAKVHLMLRLHCDAEGGTGAAVFYPDRPGKAKDGARGPSREVLQDSRRAAEAFHPAFRKETVPGLRDRGLMTDTRTYIGGKQGALTGSIYSKVPVLLVEMCVLTSPRDEAFITSRAGEARMVRALVQGAEAAALRIRADEQAQAQAVQYPHDNHA